MEPELEAELQRAVRVLEQPVTDAERSDLGAHLNAFVDLAKRDGWPPERVIVTVTRIVRSGGLDASMHVRAEPQYDMMTTDPLLVEIIGWCVDRYYERSEQVRAWQLLHRVLGFEERQAGMAKTAIELFDVFAARVAEILRDRHGLDPEPLLRTRRDSFTLEGLIRRADGSSDWHGVRATTEQLEWNGPTAMAEAFVEAYLTAFRAATDT